MRDREESLRHTYRHSSVGRLTSKLATPQSRRAQSVRASPGGQGAPWHFFSLFPRPPNFATGAARRGSFRQFPSFLPPGSENMLAHANFANLVGVSRETVSRIFRRLREESLIVHNKRGLCIPNRKQLEQRAFL